MLCSSPGSVVVAKMLEDAASALQPSSGADGRYRSSSVIIIAYYNYITGRPQTDDKQLERSRRVQARIRAALEDAEMSVEDLARESEINRRSLDKYLEGDSPSPSFFFMVKIARSLGFTLDELALASEAE